MRKIVAKMLDDLGYDDVMLAANGQEALGLLDARVVDLLLTNWNMPVMDGLELVRRLRERVENARLPILMFSTRSSRKDVVEALKVGVNGYLAKPFTRPQLKQRIDFILKRQTEKLARQVAESKDPMRREDTYPLMVIGDGMSVPSQLVRPEHARTLHTLADAAEATKRLNGDAEPPLLGVVIGHDSGDLSRALRAIGQRTKLLILTTKVHGSGLTLARLTSINKRSDLNVALVYDQHNEITDRERLNLTSMGVQMFERGRLDAASFQQLLVDEVLVHAESRRPSQLPTPDQIRNRLEADIRTTVALPVLPQVFHEIATLSRDPDSDLAHWAEVIERDPLAAAQIVRRARSPAYGFRGEVRQLDQAVVLLGKNAVSEIIVSEAVQRAFETVRDDDFKIEEFGAHSIAVGHLTQLLSLPLQADQRTPAQQKDYDAFELDDVAMAAIERAGLVTRIKIRDHENPFVVGVMHDIGKVALVESYPGLYRAVCEELERQQYLVPMRRAEEIVAGGADHTVVGGLLAETWQLGETIRAVISDHHRTDGQDPLLDLVAIADLLTNAIFPLPAGATFPLGRLAGTLQAPPADGKDESDPAADKPEPESTVEDVPPEPEQLAPFLPGGLLERLDLSIEKVIELAQVLAEPLRQRVQKTQQGPNLDAPQAD
ncbi:MAG: HDOD domain-containing protein [Gemmatimonadetes bacterium]|nr:HDOD domain-containing protein [Gemmatimonadota bacterium]MBT7863782.1 HDOD domain-containing protein [Gemmatimonadota bacterium]